MSLRPLVLVALTAFALAPRAQDIACTDGIAVLPDVGAFPCENIDLVGYLPVASFATDESPAPVENNDIWGWTDPQTGTEYALVGTTNGVGFVDLTDPSFPRLVGKLPTNSIEAVWRDVKVYADHAFVVADGAQAHGMQVFDLTRLRGLSGDPATFTADAVYDQIRSAHNIVINEETGFAYAVGARYPPGPTRADLGLPASCDAPGFHVIDISDPTDPTFVTCFSDAARETDLYIAAGYTHDAQCLIYDGPDSDYADRELCVGANEDVVTFFDVTDKDDVQIISQGEYPNDVYTHQGWFTDDLRFFLVNDEIDERTDAQSGGDGIQRTIVFDVSDLDEPDVAFIYESGIRTIDHNLYVRGDLAFESNYESGLRVLDLGQIGEGTMTEVAYFDTYPDEGGLDYSGQWSNYPYFESGLVVVNDINYGFFVLRPDASLAVARDEAPTPSGYALSEPVPNPTASGARLALRVDEPQSVRAELFDVAGRRVASVFDGVASPGAEVALQVSGAGLPSGVYIVRVVGETFEAARRIVITR